MWLWSVSNFHFGAVWKSRRHAAPGREAYAVFFSCIFSLLLGKNYARKLIFFLWPFDPISGHGLPLRGFAIMLIGQTHNRQYYSGRVDIWTTLSLGGGVW